MVLKPQDIVILLKLVAIGDREWNYVRLAEELFISVSETHGGLHRATAYSDDFGHRVRGLSGQHSELIPATLMA